MKKFFNHHQDLLLGGAAVLLTAILLAFFVWGVKNLIPVIGKTVTAGSGGGGELRFNIEEYERLKSISTPE